MVNLWSICGTIFLHKFYRVTALCLQVKPGSYNNFLKIFLFFKLLSRLWSICGQIFFAVYLLLISVLFTGEAREVHQICVLVGYGADAICPYMVFEIAQMLREENVIDVNDQIAYENYAAAVDRGISKVRIQIIMSLAT